MLFGIVQGGLFKDLKEFSIRHTNSLDFDGVKLWGLLSFATSQKWISSPINNPKLSISQLYEIFISFEFFLNNLDKSITLVGLVSGNPGDIVLYSI